MAYTARDSTISVSLVSADNTVAVSGSSGVTTYIVDHNGDNIVDHNGHKLVSSLSQSGSFQGNQQRQQVSLQSGDSTTNVL